MAYLGKQLKRFQVIPTKHSLEVEAAPPPNTSSVNKPSLPPSKPSIPATATATDKRSRMSLKWLNP